MIPKRSGIHKPCRGMLTYSFLCQTYSIYIYIFYKEKNTVRQKCSVIPCFLLCPILPAILLLLLVHLHQPDRLHLESPVARLDLLLPAKIFLSLGYARSIFPVPFTSDNNSQMYICNLYLLFDWGKILLIFQNFTFRDNIICILSAYKTEDFPLCSHNTLCAL